MKKSLHITTNATTDAATDAMSHIASIRQIKERTSRVSRIVGSTSWLWIILGIMAIAYLVVDSSKLTPTAIGAMSACAGFVAMLGFLIMVKIIRYLLDITHLCNDALRGEVV